MATSKDLTEAVNNNNAAKKQPKQLTPEQQLNHTLKMMAPQIQRALPKHMNADRIARLALTAVRNTPKLLQTDQQSFLAALMQSSQLGLEPNTPLGQAYLIPYGNQTQFQIGYQGLLTLAYRTNEYKTIYAQEVYTNDEFKRELGTSPNLIHIPADEPEGDPIGYYAVFILKNGGSMFEYWSRSKVEKHARKTSKSFNNGPWKTYFDEMAKKTVLKSLLKYAPKSIEFSEQVSTDESLPEKVDGDGSIIRDITDEVDETNNEQEAIEHRETESDQTSFDDIDKALGAK